MTHTTRRSPQRAGPPCKASPGRDTQKPRRVAHNAAGARATLLAAPPAWRSHSVPASPPPLRPTAINSHWPNTPEHPLVRPRYFLASQSTAFSLPDQLFNTLVYIPQSPRSTPQYSGSSPPVPPPESTIPCAWTRPPPAPDISRQTPAARQTASHNPPRCLAHSNPARSAARTPR